MERRELLKLIATATGTALFAGNVLAYTDVPAVPLSDTLFNEKDVALLNEDSSPFFSFNRCNEPTRGIDLLLQELSGIVGGIGI